MTRTQYLKTYSSVEWQKVRLKVFERDKWICQHCKRGDKQLQVHHLKYNWNEPCYKIDMKWLQSLCVSCHEKETERLKLAKTIIKHNKNKNFKTRVDKIYNRAKI